LRLLLRGLGHSSIGCNGGWPALSRDMDLTTVAKEVSCSVPSQPPGCIMLQAECPASVLPRGSACAALAGRKAAVPGVGGPFCFSLRVRLLYIHAHIIRAMLLG
jgi:hypothetical protein